MPIPSLDRLLSTPDLWQSLQAEKRDILLYGMGNGADKILAVMAERHIPAAGVFASDGFVRGQSFHGMRVLSYSEVKTRYVPGECVVLPAFGSGRPEVLALIDEVAERYPLYVPDVPVCGSNLFDAAFLKENRAAFTAARSLFEDEPSKALFDLVLAYKLTGKYDYLKAAVRPSDTEDLILSPATVRHMTDLGAYNGDTIRGMMAKSAILETVVAAEPDRRNFKKLSDFAENLTRPRVFCHQAAVSDRSGEAAFDASGNRNAGLCTGRATEATTVRTATVDELLAGNATDYIKYDVEGAEAAALRGSAETLRRCSPRLKLAAYHRSEDLFALPLLLHELAPQYRLYLTRLRCIPAWDLDILAVPRENAPLSD